MADCFRAHGHPDFPDPAQGSDGTCTVPGRLQTPDAEGLWQPAASGPGKALAPPAGPVIAVPHG